MKIRRAAFIGAVLVASFLDAAEPVIEFSGVLTAGGKTRVALTNTATKTTTWVEAGDQFNGYTIARYDAKEEAVFLKKSGQETRLTLVSAKTSDPGRSSSAGGEKNADATATAVRANLRILAAAARQYQVARGVTSVAFSDLVGPDKMLKEIKPVAGENYSTLTFGANGTGSNVTTANGATISLEPSPVTALAPAAPVAAQPPAPPPNAPASTAAGSGVPAAVTPETPPATAAPESSGRQPAAPSYTIQGGDTLQKISESTGVPIPQLKQLNPTIVDGRPLPAGQTIRIR